METDRYFSPQRNFALTIKPFSKDQRLTVRRHLPVVLAWELPFGWIFWAVFPRDLESHQKVGNSILNFARKMSEMKYGSGSVPLSPIWAAAATMSALEAGADLPLWCSLGFQHGRFGLSYARSRERCFAFVSLFFAGDAWMTEATFYQFSKEVWKAVTEQARGALVRKEFSPEDSRIESLRCVFLDEECESNYGRQVWFFEASGVDPIGKKHRLYGALDFSVQYGLLEPIRAMLADEPRHRQRLLQSIANPIQHQVWATPSTKVWVRLTVSSVIILSAIWLLMLARYMM